MQKKRDPIGSGPLGTRKTAGETENTFGNWDDGLRRAVAETRRAGGRRRGAANDGQTFDEVPIERRADNVAGDTEGNGSQSELNQCRSARSGLNCHRLRRWIGEIGKQRVNSWNKKVGDCNWISYEQRGESEFYWVLQSILIRSSEIFGNKSSLYHFLSPLSLFSNFIIRWKFMALACWNSASHDSYHKPCPHFFFYRKKNYRL